MSQTNREKVSTKNAVYPSQYETEVILTDGSAMVLRPIKSQDAESWLAFLSRLGPYSKYLRLQHIPSKATPEGAARFATVDYQNTLALVGEVRRQGRKDIVAVGRYYRLPGKNSAEVVLVIEEAYQRKGIGTKLIEWLAKAARDNGITCFEADISEDNKDIMSLLNSYGFHVERQSEADVYHVTFPISPTRVIEQKEEKRERVATVASVRRLLFPESVALIGASRYPNTIGNLILQCMISGGYTGTVYPVNPNTTSVMSVKSYPSILEIPEAVDMAVIAVPAKLVAKIADECGQKGVHTLVVISDGFREVGPEGVLRERELRDIAMGHGMRVAGPNCMGIINADAKVSLNATFSPVFPPSGEVAFLSQSGAMGLTILEYAKNLNMGMSSFVSIGNRVDISSNDVLEYWEQDPATKVILLYLESFGNPRKFTRIARRVSAKKPVVVVKGGVTAAGSRAAASHTGAIATSEVSSDILFRHAGVIRVNTTEELFDVGLFFSSQPLPKGKRLVILTNGGGPGIIAADASSRHELVLPQFSDETCDKLKAVIKRDIVINNPLDTTAGATADEFRDILKILAADSGNDAVLAIFIPPVVTDKAASEAAIRAVAPIFSAQKKPLLACFLGQRGFKAKLGSNGHFVPCYPFPEEAIAALARAIEYEENRSKPKGKIPRLQGIQRGLARRIIEKAMTENRERPFWLGAAETYDLLNCYGMLVAPVSIADTAERAVEVAVAMDFPVVLKIVATSITHKSDVGGVLLNLNSEDEVRKAFERIQKRINELGHKDEMKGVVVQKMVAGGIEAIAGVTQDPSFGHLIMFGSGGIYAELIKDVALKLHPLTDLDAKEMLTSIKLAKLFEGYRGTSPSDVSSAEGSLLRLSAMVEDIPQISEMDLNPVKIMPQGQGYKIVDARILLK